MHVYVIKYMGGYGATFVSMAMSVSRKKRAYSTEKWYKIYIAGYQKNTLSCRLQPTKNLTVCKVGYPEG